MDKPVLQKTPSANELDIATLKRALRFLLPKVGSNLGPNSLLTLLSLDWASAELDLGLELENVWRTNLTSSNIIIFLCECIVSFDTSHSVEVDLAELEGLVIPAMRHVEVAPQPTATGGANQTP